MASDNNSGVPQWLADLGIKPGEFYIDSKLKLRRAMKNRCFSGPARIYACLTLHSACFQQELAVKMEGDKKVPLQPSDVCAMTGISKKHFREHMYCIEHSGLGKCEGLTKDRILLYCYAVPRPPVVPEMVPGPGTIFESFPPELTSLLKHFKVRFPSDFVPGPGTILELQRLAEAAQKAELSLRQYAKGPQNTAPLNKEEIQKEEEIVSQSVSSVIEEAQNDRLTDIANAIPEELQEQLQETPTPKLLAQINERLGGAPVANLTQRIRKRWKTITSLGIVKDFAEDVGKDYIRSQPKRMAATANGSPPKSTQDQIAWASEILTHTEDHSAIDIEVAESLMEFR